MNGEGPMRDQPGHPGDGAFAASGLVATSTIAASRCSVHSTSMGPTFARRIGRLRAAWISLGSSLPGRPRPLARRGYSQGTRRMLANPRRSPYRGCVSRWSGASRSDAQGRVQMPVVCSSSYHPSVALGSSGEQRWSRRAVHRYLCLASSYGPRARVCAGWWRSRRRLRHRIPGSLGGSPMAGQRWQSRLSSVVRSRVILTQQAEMSPVAEAALAMTATSSLECSKS